MVGQYPTIADTFFAFAVGVPEPSFVAAQVNNRLMVYPLGIFISVRIICEIPRPALDRRAALFPRRPEGTTSLPH